MEGLENELWRRWLSLHLHHNLFSNPSVTLPTSELILQPFFHFSYVTNSAHSPTFLSLHLHHNSFSNPSVASPMSQFIPQPFFRFSYVASSSLNSPGEPPMLDTVYSMKCYWFFILLFCFFFILQMYMKNSPICNSTNPCHFHQSCKYVLYYYIEIYLLFIWFGSYALVIPVNNNTEPFIY